MSHIYSFGFTDTEANPEQYGGCATLEVRVETGEKFVELVRAFRGFAAQVGFVQPNIDDLTRLDEGEDKWGMSSIEKTRASEREADLLEMVCQVCDAFKIPAGSIPWRMSLLRRVLEDGLNPSVPGTKVQINTCGGEDAGKARPEFQKCGHPLSCGVCDDDPPVQIRVG
jgi:hypothetical protein